MTYWRTYTMRGDSGPGQATHLEGIGDSYTLCGVDTAGDSMVHRKPPHSVTGRPRITCPACLQVIALVREHLNLS